MTTEKKFRPNVAAVVVNAVGEILACHRSDRKGAWQLPQGGIESGETPENALFRELEEEIGTKDVDVVGRLPQPIRYDWPEELYSRGFHGQEQVYFLVRLKPTAQIVLQHPDREQEFDQTEWISAAEFLKRIDGFKAETYRRALELLCQEFPGVIAK